MMCFLHLIAERVFTKKPKENDKLWALDFQHIYISIFSIYSIKLKLIVFERQFWRHNTRLNYVFNITTHLLQFYPISSQKIKRKIKINSFFCGLCFHQRQCCTMNSFYTPSENWLQKPNLTVFSQLIAVLNIFCTLSSFYQLFNDY